MSESVLISIQPKWCELIARGEKTLEVRKTRPKIDTPFKCFIYCTKAQKGWFWLNSPNIRRDGVVVGEFICDGIRTITASDFIVLEDAINAINGSCISLEKVKSYAGWKPCTHILSCKDIYGWHISNLKIYDKPKKLSDFTGIKTMRDGFELRILERPPQSWCYVDAVEDSNRNKD